MKFAKRSGLVTIWAVAGCAVAVTAYASAAAAEEPCQKMQMPKAAEVENVWVNPPSEYGPEPYFGMNGPVKLESLAEDLDTMKALGFRAVTAQAGWGMTATYLSPEYFAFFKRFVEEAKKRGMKGWIVDDIGYPSGFAGGLFAKEKANLQMQALTIAQQIPVAAGAELNQPVGPEVTAASAVNAAGGSRSIPVTSTRSI